MKTIHEVESQRQKNKKYYDAKADVRSFHAQRRSGILEDDAFDDVRHILAAIGHGFEKFVNGLELD